MATQITVGDLVARLVLDKTGYTKGLSGAQKEALTVTDNVRAGFGQLKTAIIAAFAGITFKAIISETAKFDDQLRLVNTQLVGAATDYLPRFRDGLLQMAQDYGETTESLAGGLYDILSATIPAKDAMGLLEESTKAARGGFTTTAVAADALTSIINAYGMSAEDAAAISDILFTSVLRGKMTYEELASQIGDVARLAAVCGVSLKELTAMVSIITRNGVPAAEAVTQVKGALTAMLDPSDKAAKLASSLGIEMDAAAIKSRGFQAVMEDLGELPPDVLAKLFPNVRGLMGVVNAAGAMNTEVAKFNSIMAEGSPAQAAFEKRSGSLDNTLNKMRETLRVVAIEFGTGLMPSLVKALENVRAAIVDSFGSIEGFGERVGNIIEIAGNVIAKLFEWKEVAVALGAAIFGLPKLLSAFASGMSLLGINASAALGPIGLVTTAAWLLGSAVMSAKRHGDDMNATLREARKVADEAAPSMDELERAISNVNETIEDLNNELLTPSFLTTWSSMLTDWVMPLAKKAGALVGVEVEGVKEAIREERDEAFTLLLDLQTKREETRAAEKKAAEERLAAERAQAAATVETMEISAEAAQASEEAASAEKARLEQKARLEDEYADKLAEQLFDSIRLIEYRRDKEIAAAEAVGADTVRIVIYYAGLIDAERKRLADEERDRQDKLQKEAEKRGEEILQAELDNYEAVVAGAERAVKEQTAAAERLAAEAKARIADGEANEKAARHTFYEGERTKSQRLHDEYLARFNKKKEIDAQAEQATLEMLQDEWEARQAAATEEAALGQEVLDARKKREEDYYDAFVEATNARLDAERKAAEEQKQIRDKASAEFHALLLSDTEKALEELERRRQGYVDAGINLLEVEAWYQSEQEKLFAEEETSASKHAKKLETTLNGIWESVGGALKDNLLDAVYDLGEALGEAKSIGASVAIGLENLGDVIMKMLPQLLLQAGLSVIAANLPLGIALIAASGLIALTSGVLSGRASAEEAAKAKLQELEDDKEAAQEEWLESSNDQYENALRDLAAKRSYFMKNEVSSEEDIWDWYLAEARRIKQEQYEASPEYAFQQETMTEAEAALRELTDMYEYFQGAGIPQEQINEWWKTAMAEYDERYPVEIPAAAGGGMLEGAPGVDRNLVRVSAGEFIVNRRATADNLDLLQRINAGLGAASGFSVTPGEVQIVLDGRVIARAVVPYLTEESDRGRLRINPRAIGALS
jgi:TP901 family phage tail tape measure protein